jgi:hypothetical protein
MKKLIVTLAVVGSVAGAAFGQGHIYFNSSAQANTQISTNSGTIGKVTGAGNYLFALYKATSTAVTTVNGTNNPYNSTTVTPWTDVGWAFTGLYATNISSAGRILGCNDPGLFEVVPGAPVGSTQNFLIIGWDAASGGHDINSLMVAYTAGTLKLYGSSGLVIGAIMGDGGATQGDGALIGGNANQTIGWGLSAPPAVPEPATFALAGLGAAAMLIFRRRK